MRMRDFPFLRLIIVILLGVVAAPVLARDSHHDYAGPRTWQSLRDAKVVRQTYDYSCGASSIATLLTHQFGDPISEYQVLGQLPALDRPYSLTDMQVALLALGYETITLRGNYAALEALNSPSIVYLHPRRTRTTVGHFVVVRSVGPENIVIADPASGSRTYSKDRFLKMWQGLGRQRSGIFLLARAKELSIVLPSPPTHPLFSPEAQPFFWRGGQQQRFLAPMLF